MVFQMNSSIDPRRVDKINRYKPASQGAGSEDLVPDYMNILGNFVRKSKLLSPNFLATKSVFISNCVYNDRYDSINRGGFISISETYKSCE